MHKLSENGCPEANNGGPILVCEGAQMKSFISTTKIMSEFNTLFTSTCQSFESRKLNAKAIAKHMQVCIHGLDSKILDGKDMTDLFYDIIYSYVHWYNCGLIEDLIRIFGDSGDQERLKGYLQTLVLFRPRR